jgi:uncharacterized protein YfaS (alpha-2-macroglobulin family)
MLLAVATDRIVETRYLQATTDGMEVAIPIDGAWGAGAYLLATAFRPSEESDEHGPGRAIGVAWLGIDPAARTLTIDMDVPESVLPRQTIEVPVSVAGATGEGPTYLTIAAVDEGILQLTDYATPDPVGYFFGKRRLGVEIRDLYGNLINGRDGERGQLRSGGDTMALARRGAPPVNVQMVALFSGMVQLDDKGQASIPLKLPDFNGRLRLMAVAYDSDKVGMAEGALVVRDPVVVQTSMPRFLASGDESELTVTLRNVSGGAGVYKIELNAEGPVTILEGAAASPELAAGAGTDLRAKLRATEMGVGIISMSVSGPDGFNLARDLSLGVRPPQLAVVERTSRRLAPGESLTLNQAALERFVPGSGELYASFSPRPNLDVPGLLRSLDRYPYGCIEQTTSRALPLLYVGDISALWQVDDEAPDMELKRRIEQAIFRVIEGQRFDGAFGLWRADSPPEAWLSAYAMEFLVRARQKGYAVPDLVLDQGLRWLEEYTRNFQDDSAEALGARAYAHYVLARMNAGDLGGVRYIHDNQLKRLPTGLAAAQLAAALALYGDQERASAAFKFASEKVERERRTVRDYGSPLRDLAATLTLQLESGANENPGPLLDRLVGLEFGDQYLSTQEQAWLVMAANAVAETGRESMTLAIDGEVQEATSGTVDIRPDPDALRQGVTVANTGNASLWSSATVIGAPIADLPARANGFTIERQYFTLAGEPVVPDTVKQSDILVVVLSGKSDGHDNRQALLIDLLPAGFEIENARLSDSRSAEQIGWLTNLTPTQHVEFRDDRFVAAFDLDWGRRDYKVAYLVRAVTPGKYRLPAAEIEDMYLPEYRARTAMGNVTVTSLP